MTPEQRIHELTTRQVYYGSSLVCKLNAVDGKWFYTILAWYSVDNKTDNKFVVLINKYNGEDPEALFELALKELSLKKIKLGKPVPDVHSWGLAK